MKALKSLLPKKIIVILNELKIKVMEEISLLREEVKALIDKADEKTIRMIYAMLEASTEEDWWDELNDEEKKEINGAIEESKNDENLIPFEKFKSKFNTWRKELLSSKEQKTK
jgi:hypothetical protein